jgi:hypothetical protein
MTDQELRDLVANLARSSGELQKAQAETERQIRQTNKQLGELGNKFGSFAEGMALPSMQKVLYERFGMGIVLPRAKSRLNGHSLEVDTLAYDSVNQEEAYVVEVKSHLTSEGIQQILQTIARVPKFFPHLANRKIYGILAAVHASEQIKNEVLNQGLYLARISDETFKLQVPKKFQAKAFGTNGMETEGKRKKGKKSSK